ncbi:hypothetical protein [Megamonas hypermegale]|uniref:hypothetical protein n=1 Tax=Megamonas hypermegale TaxID=158847 RepID=UPI0026F104B9|nr:hypothetical protein [Megamonas hypermegale]
MKTIVRLALGFICSAVIKYPPLKNNNIINIGFIWCNVIAPGTFSLLSKEEVPQKKLLSSRTAEIFSL